MQILWEPGSPVPGHYPTLLSPRVMANSMSVSRNCPYCDAELLATSPYLIASPLYNASPIKAAFPQQLGSPH